MTLKRLLTLFALLSVLISSVAFAAPAAGQSNAPGAAELCREIDDEGEFNDVYCITRGECVNLVKGPGSEQSNNVAAAICGSELVRAIFGGTNKGQCIQEVRDL